jgi:hypothetical protein
VFVVPESRMKFPDEQPVIVVAVAMSFLMGLSMMGKEVREKTGAEDTPSE